MSVASVHIKRGLKTNEPKNKEAQTLKSTRSRNPLQGMISFIMTG
uniref:Uncharacterized protein n=1 Tax=Anguilla anguilla TaxID=7936 RepID=A0A0E9R7J1_ANGAN